MPRTNILARLGPPALFLGAALLAFFWGFGAGPGAPAAARQAPSADAAVAPAASGDADEAGGTGEDRDEVGEVWLTPVPLPENRAEPRAAEAPKPPADLAPVKAANGLYGYANQAGVLFINPVYEAANPFGEDDAAWVKLDGRYGLLDVEGRWLVEPRLDFVMVADFFPDSLAEAQSPDGGRGFINRSGEWVVEPVYQRTRGFRRGSALAPVQNADSLWGYIDADGDEVIPPRFANARQFDPGGLALVKTAEEAWGFIDLKGEFVIGPKFVDARSFGANGLAAVRLEEGGLFGFIDRAGRLVVEPEFGDVSAPSRHSALSAAADADGLWGFVDRQGEWVIGPKYARLSPFAASGFARFKQEDGTMGLINENGQVVLEPQFDYVGDFTVLGEPVEYTNALSSSGLWGIVNKSGEWVVAPDHSLCLYRLDGLTAVKADDGESWSYLNLAGDSRVPLGYLASRDARPE
ncbi:MAG: WG repeat-containing protein [Deltaproteobacteria bacterium]|nr:WG repeat-containing protein [Deltaproteobacteria bacterium]